MTRSPTTQTVAGLIERLDSLCGKSARTIAVTGIRRGDQIGVACSDTRNGGGRIEYRLAPYCETFFPGCGDLLASVLLAGVLACRTASDTLGQAVSFISEVSYKTQRLGTPPREGVVFENELYRPDLTAFAALPRQESWMRLSRPPQGRSARVLCLCIPFP